MCVNLNMQTCMLACMHTTGVSLVKQHLFARPMAMLNHEPASLHSDSRGRSLVEVLSNPHTEPRRTRARDAGDGST